MDNLEKLAKLGTQDIRRRQTNHKTQHNMYWTQLDTQVNTNNVNKTWTFLQTIGGKDEPNIVFMRKS